MKLARRLGKFLQRSWVATIGELCKATDRAEITVKQALAKLEYLTSYNQKARFYALRSRCRFDRHGIWRHKEALFTRHGTLPALLVALIDESRSGHTCAELEAITRVVVAGALRSLAMRGQVARVRWRRTFFYFTARSKRRRASQARSRFGTSALVARYQGEDATLEQLKNAISVLLEIIRTRPKTLRGLRETMSRTHPNLGAGTINEVCRQYGLDLKKKIDPYLVFEKAVELGKAFRERTGRAFVFHFRSDQRSCPICWGLLRHYRTTRVRAFQSIRYGKVPFQETQVCCAKKRHLSDDGVRRIYGSSFLRSLAPVGASVAYDAIVEIGKKRVVEFHQVQEVVEEFQSSHRIALGFGSVSRWTDFFLAAVECLHYTRMLKLKHLIKSNGGYLLHIDATTEVKSDTVFVCMDRLSETVLLSEKISSENAEEVKRQLERLKQNLGTPLAIMRDMSESMGNPVGEVFPDAPDRICQFHFLRDIGRELLGPLHVKVGHEMTRLKINSGLRKMKRELEKELSADGVERACTVFRDASAIEQLQAAVVREHEAVLALRLIDWILNYSNDGEGLGFPFDMFRLYFYARLNRVRLRLARYKRRHPVTMKHCPRLQGLQQIVERITDDSLRADIRALRSKNRVFQNLRSVLNFEITDRAPLATTLSVGTIKEVRAYNRRLLSYTKHLLAEQRKGKITQEEKVILKHFTKYQFNLPIPEQLAELLLLGALDRTNNFEESLFRGVKRKKRRQLGKKDISREFSHHGPYLPLMENLTNEDYVGAMIGRIEDLPIRISELNPKDVAYYRQKLLEARRGRFFDSLRQINAINLLPRQ